MLRARSLSPCTWNTLLEWNRFLVGALAPASSELRKSWITIGQSHVSTDCMCGNADVLGGAGASNEYGAVCRVGVEVNPAGRANINTLPALLATFAHISTPQVSKTSSRNGSIVSVMRIMGSAAQTMAIKALRNLDGSRIRRSVRKLQGCGNSASRTENSCFYRQWNVVCAATTELHGDEEKLSPFELEGSFMKAILEEFAKTYVRSVTDHVCQERNAKRSHYEEDRLGSWLRRFNRCVHNN